MTEKIYTCYAEFWKYGVPDNMKGQSMTLMEWLLKTGKSKKADYSFKNADDEDVIDFLRQFRGKYLVDV